MCQRCVYLASASPATAAACRSCFAVQVDPSAGEAANIVNTAGLSLIMARAVCLLAGDVQGSVTFSQEVSSFRFKWVNKN